MLELYITNVYLFEFFTAVFLKLKNKLYFGSWVLGFVSIPENSGWTFPVFCCLCTAVFLKFKNIDFVCWYISYIYHAPSLWCTPLYATCTMYCPGRLDVYWLSLCLEVYITWCRHSIGVCWSQFLLRYAPDLQVFSNSRQIEKNGPTISSQTNIKHAVTVHTHYPMMGSSRYTKIR
jgi:hypothetical protein